VQPAAAAGALLPLQGHVFHMSLNRQSRAAAR
jgi:hypothetical protein